MRARRHHSAFTLFETLLALGLIVVLSAAVFSFLFSLAGRRDSLSRAGEERRALGTVLTRLDADLSCAVAAVPGLGAGISGTSTSVRILTRGVDLDAAARGAPEGSADLISAEYRFDERAGAIVASRRAVPVEGAPESSGERACDGVRRVRVRYFDGRSWADAFDSGAAGRLPGAVEVAVWMGAVKPDNGDVRGAPDEVLVVAIPDAGGAEP